jgi:hypothetical protein
MVAIDIELPSGDVADVQLDPTPIESLGGVIEVIDAAEATLGTLLGHCGCGRPGLAYYDGEEPR